MPIRGTLKGYDVKDYGAIGSGMVDDTIAIQNCLDDAASTGGTVFFPFGTYLVGRSPDNGTPKKNLIIKGNNVHLLGEEGATILMNTNADESEGLLESEGVQGSTARTDDITIENLVIRGYQSRISGKGAKYAIFFKRADRLRIIRCRVERIFARDETPQTPPWNGGAIRIHHSTSEAIVAFNHIELPVFKKFGCGEFLQDHGRCV